MFQQRRPIVAIVAIAIVLLVGVSSIANNAGWWEGYQVGLLTSGAAGGKLAPQAIQQGGWGYHHGGFGFFGGFFRLIFFLFFLGLIAKFFGFWRWRMHHGGPGHHHWSHQGPWGQEPRQPGGERPSIPPADPAAAGEQKPQNTSWINV
jgi:hypothetical protein